MFCTLLVAGCQNTSSARVDQNVKAAADIHKAELLKELDKKWENPPVHFELGQLYHAAGDYSKAEYYYNQALNFNPAYREVQAAIVKLQLDKGDKPKADWVANSYMTQVASIPEQLLSLGAAFDKQGLDDYALKCYQEALKTAPDSPLVNRQLGYYYLTRNKKDLAKEYFIRSFQLNPDQADVAGELGRLGVAVRIPEAPTPPPQQQDIKQTTKPASQPK
jgi:tetratricopeptide (TPR) repeat protein